MNYLGATGSTALLIGSKQYSLQQLYGKTLYATKNIPVYKTYLSATPEFTITPNNIVGIVQGFVSKGYNNAPKDFFLIGPTTQSVKAVPYDKTFFSETKLVQQGAKDVKKEDKEKADEIADENIPWYVASLKTIMPYALIATIAYILIKNKK